MVCVVCARVCACLLRFLTWSPGHLLLQCLPSPLLRLPYLLHQLRYPLHHLCSPAASPVPPRCVCGPGAHQAGVPAVPGQARLLLHHLRRAGEDPVHSHVFISEASGFSSGFSSSSSMYSYLCAWDDTPSTASFGFHPPRPVAHPPTSIPSPLSPRAVQGVRHAAGEAGGVPRKSPAAARLCEGAGRRAQVRCCSTHCMARLCVAQHMLMPHSFVAHKARPFKPRASYHCTALS